MVTVCPKEWKTSEIGEVVSKTKQRNPRKKPDGYFKYVDVSSVSNTLYKITDYSTVIGQDAPSRAQKIINTKDVIIATVRPTLRRIAIVPDYLNDEICSTGYCVLKPLTNEIYFKFLYYCLITGSFLERMKSIQRGANYPAVRDSDIKKTTIPLPPLPEQRKIAHILTTVQKAIEKQEEIIKATTELKKAMMQKLFTEGLRGEQQIETEIGLVPESWKVVELGRICEKLSENYIPTTNGNTPYVGLEHIIPSCPRLCTWGLESEVKSSKTKFNKGSILYGKLRPYLEKAVIAPFNGICSTDILVFNGKENIQNNFLIQLFHTDKLIEFAKSTTTGVQHPRTSWSSLKKLKIGLPDNPERIEIANSLSVLDIKIEFHSKKKTNLENLFKSLLNQLMTGQLRINNIDFPNLEPD